jgi:ABC-type nitrate/sulfonate/bicarbonate transport system substrate-binding protein
LTDSDRRDRFERSARPRGRRSFSVLSSLFVVILAALFVPSCSPKGYSGPVASITLAYAPYLETALYWIALDQGYFARNGLNVTLRKYDNLAPAVDAMLNGEVDIVGNSTEFPLVSRAFQNAKISALASVAQSNTVSLVARRDRGITQVSDLKGKRVGSIFGTITDFFLGRLLELNGMSTKDITPVDVKTAAASVGALVSGEIDALVVSQPYASSARDQLGANAYFQSAQSGQSLYALAVCQDDWIASHPELITRFLKSLAQSEDFIARHPAEAKAAIRAGLNFDQAYLESIWPQSTFSLSLYQLLIITMEDEARWEISNGLVSAKAVPNFLDYIYADGLKSVDAGAVRIVGK